jgi:hypothetical protein
MCSVTWWIVLNVERLTTGWNEENAKIWWTGKILLSEPMLAVIARTGRGSWYLGYLFCHSQSTARRPIEGVTPVGRRGRTWYWRFASCRNKSTVRV